MALHDPVATDRITARDLLCHHSRLPRHDWIWMPGDPSPAQMLAAMRYLEPSDDIRSTFQYLNLGYLVASMLTERVSGQSWIAAACRVATAPYLLDFQPSATAAWYSQSSIRPLPS